MHSVENGESCRVENLAGETVPIYIRHDVRLAENHVLALHDGREARAPRKHAVTWQRSRIKKQHLYVSMLGLGRLQVRETVPCHMPKLFHGTAVQIRSLKHAQAYSELRRCQKAARSIPTDNCMNPFPSSLLWADLTPQIRSLSFPALLSVGLQDI